MVVIFLFHYFDAAFLMFPFLHLLLLEMLCDLGIAKAWLLRFVNNGRLNAT